MATDPAARAYRFGPPEHRSLLAGLRAPQVAALAAGGLGGLAVLKVLPSGLGLVLATTLLGAGAAGAFVTIGGRALDEWAPVVGRWALRRRRRWISVAPAEGSVSGRRGVPIPPPTLAGVRLLAVTVAGRDDDIGVLADAAAGTWVGVVAVRGRAFALLDGVEQERRLAAWADVLAGWARDGSVVHRLQWIERTVPDDGAGLARYVDDAAVDDAVPGAGESYRDLIDAAPAGTCRHEAYVVLSVSARRSGRRIRRAGGAERGAAELVVAELRRLEDRLGAADIDVERILDARRVAVVLRASFDPAAASDLAARDDEASMSAGVMPRNAYPLATEVAWDRYRTDGTWHATFWVAEWPRAEVGADFLAPLILQATGIRSVSVVMEPVPAARASRAAEAAHTSYLADEELRARAGYLTTARRQRQAESIARRESELADGHADVRFSAYVTVSAADPDALEEACAEVTHAAHLCRLDLRRLYGEQDRAFTTTLPLARGLA